MKMTIVDVHEPNLHAKEIVEKELSYIKDDGVKIYVDNHCKIWTNKFGQLHRTDGPAKQYKNDRPDVWALGGVPFNSKRRWEDALQNKKGVVLDGVVTFDENYYLHNESGPAILIDMPVSHSNIFIKEYFWHGEYCKNVLIFAQKKNNNIKRKQK